MLQFSAGQLQISDRGDYECSEFQCTPLFHQNVRFSAQNFVFLETNFSKGKIQGVNCPLVPCYDATNI